MRPLQALILGDDIHRIRVEFMLFMVNSDEDSPDHQNQRRSPSQDDVRYFQMTFDLCSGACNNMRMTRGATELLILLCMILQKVQMMQ